MKSSLASLLLAVAAVVPAQASGSKVPPATMVPTTDAALTAISGVIADSKSRQAELNGRAAALKRQIAAIKSRAKNSKIEIGEQLSKDDLDAYNLLNAQLRYLESAATVEAVRQRDLAISKDIYQASFFVATMMTEYIGDKGVLDDNFDEFCRAKAKTYGLDVSVGLLLSAQDYVISTGDKK